MSNHPTTGRGRATAAAAHPSGSGAFFDVDETLIDTKSMFSFLEFYLRRCGEPPSTYQRLIQDLRALADRDIPRTQINRQYYRLYAGHDARAVAQAGRDWFSSHLEQGLFIPETVHALHTHQTRGDFTVLLSGSFFACLDPIATHLDAHWAIGTRPVIRDGTLTGDIVTPMIGPAKARTAHATAAVRALDLTASTAYGDHITDLDLLNSVGHPVVVGHDPQLHAHATTHGWRHLTPAA